MKLSFEIDHGVGVKRCLLKVLDMKGEGYELYFSAHKSA